MTTERKVTDCLWIKYLEGAAVALQAAMGFRLYPFEESYNKRAAAALSAMLPYCLLPVSGPGRFIWVNRDFKPLGVGPYLNSVHYESFPWMHVSGNDPLLAGLFAHLNIPSDYRDSIYLFSENDAPWNSKKNAEKLLVLLYLIIERAVEPSFIDQIFYGRRVHFSLLDRKPVFY